MLGPISKKTEVFLIRKSELKNNGNMTEIRCTACKKKNPNNYIQKNKYRKDHFLLGKWVSAKENLHE